MLSELGLDAAKVLVVLRPAARRVALSPSRQSVVSADAGTLGRLDNVHAVVLPRTDEQRDYVKSLALPSVIVPEQRRRPQSLIAFGDVVVSAGGTMNREAVALGVPVYTTFGGRLGGVDEALMREGKLTPLTDPAALPLEKRGVDTSTRVRRDPNDMLELLLSALQD